MAALSATLIKEKKIGLLGNESGIAIGPILFLIAIIGILAAAISAGAGLFSGSTSKENARLMAGAVLDYMKQVDYGTNLILGRGYSDEEISFELPSGPLTKYAEGDWADDTVNPKCLTTSCKVYYAGGGGIVPKAMPPAAFDMTILDAQPGCTPEDGYFLSCVVAWTYQVGIKGLGQESSAKLALLIPAISKDVCVKINEHVGIDNPGGNPPTIANSMQSWGNPFKGDYDFVPVSGKLIGDARAISR